MAKFSLLTTLLLESGGFTQGINAASKATQEMGRNISESGGALTKIMGQFGGMAGEMSSTIGGIAGAATGIGLVTVAIGGLIKAFKLAKESADAYLAAVDKSGQGAGIFTQDAANLMKKQMTAERGGVGAERGIELRTGVEMAALDIKRLANWITGNKVKNDGIKLTEAELKAQNDQAHAMEKINQEILDGDRDLGNRITKEVELKKILLDQYDLRKEAVQESVKNAEVEEKLKKDRAIITDKSGDYSPAQKKEALVDFESTALAYAKRREDLIDREITNTKALGELTKVGGQVNMEIVTKVAELEKEKHNVGTTYWQEEIAQNRLLSRVKKDALAEEMQAERDFHKLKEANMTSEAGFKLGEKDVNVGTVKNPFVEERAGYANTKQLEKPAANAVGGGATEANKVKDADKALRAYGGTLKSVIDLNNKYADAQERINNAFGDFASSISQGASSFKEFGKTVASSMKQAIAALLSATIAQAIEKSVAFAKNPIIGVALGAVMGGLAATLFNSLVPKFAEGAIVSGPTQALVGEYANARNNPEVIAPLSQLKHMLGSAGGGRVEFRIDGTQLVGVLNNHNRQSNNYR